jgi:hypothetical protein
VWAKIISGEYKDDSFHGLEFFVECLAKYVWYYKPITTKLISSLRMSGRSLYKFITSLIKHHEVPLRYLYFYAHIKIKNNFTILFLHRTMSF